MPLTQLENELRALARQLISEGRLPHLKLVRYWGGDGHGDACSLCSKAINHGDVELEIETGEATRAGHVFRFHFLCHAAWQLECARAEYLKQGEGGQTVSLPQT